MAQDVPVFARARLAFIGIDAQISRVAALLRHKGPLQAGRKAGAAAAAQTRVLDLLDDPVAPLEDQILGAVPIAAAPGAGEPPIVAAIKVGEDTVLVGEHWFSLIRVRWSGRLPAQNRAVRPGNRVAEDYPRAARRPGPPSSDRRDPRKNRY